MDYACGCDFVMFHNNFIIYAPFFALSYLIITMKKLILLSALSLFLIIGFAASSQAQDNATLIKSMTHTDSPVDTSTTPYVPNGKVNFQLIADYNYKAAGDSNAVNQPYKGQSVSPGFYQLTPKTDQAFNARRLYFGYDYNFTRNFTGQVLLADEPAEEYGSSAAAATNAGPINADGTNGVYVKMANVQWKNMIPYAKLTFGQQAPPTFVGVTEYLWAYRSIEKTIMDMRGIGSSTDFGIQLAGKFDQTGDYGYTAMIGDGSNKKPDFSKYKKYYGSLNGFFLDHHLMAEAYFDYMPQSDSTHYMTMKFFAAALFDPCTVGLEYVQQPAVAAVANASKVVSATDQDPTGLSIWARGKIVGSTLGYFARYDMWNPDSKYTQAYYHETFATAGLDYQPETNLHIMPNIWLENYSGQNGAATRNGDFVYRLTFFTKIP